MKSLAKFFTVFFLLTGTLFTFTSAQAEIRYTITDLGTLGGTNSMGTHINNLGQVVGTSCLPNGVLHTFFYDGATVRDLGSLDGHDTVAYDINDKSQIVGISYVSQDQGIYEHAFLWENETMHDLNINTWQMSSASGINNSSQIVGVAVLKESGLHPVFWTENTIGEFNQIIGDFGGINNQGQLIGSYYLGGDRTHAFFAENNTLWNLGTLGGKDSIAQAINNEGQVIGYSYILSDDETQHPFLWDKNSGMQDLGFPVGCTTAVACGINDLGQVVGYAGNQKDDPYADPYCGFLYENGNNLNLNTLIDPNSGWTLQTASDINNLGQITGYGDLDGLQHAFLLTPVPEPVTFIYWGALLGFFCKKQYSRFNFLSK